MVMDLSSVVGFSDYRNGYEVDDEIMTNRLRLADPSFNFDSMDVSNPSFSLEDDSFGTFSGESLTPSGETWSLFDDSPSDEGDPVLKYISQMLMEDKPCMFHDPLALKATEKSLYDILGRNTPASPDQPLFHVDRNFESPDDLFTGHGHNFGDLQWAGDLGGSSPFLFQNSLTGQHISFSDSQPYSPLHLNISNGMSGYNGNGLVDTSQTELLAWNCYSDSESILEFKRGLEEASKFLPRSNQLTTDLPNKTLSPESNIKAPEMVVDVMKYESENSLPGSRDRKNHRREVIELEEGRSSKQSAVYVEESELSEMFDRVLLSTDEKGKPSACTFIETLKNVAKKILQPNGQQLHKSDGGKTRVKKQVKKKETVDLRGLLILCAQAVSTDDRKTANELLKQIRQHSSPLGDGSQRLAHYFANGLEARLDGSGNGVQTFYFSPASKRLSAADLLKSYRVYLSACPFKKISYFFANKMIMDVAEKATVLHIVDFGISYGFHWPILIQHLAARPGGPPKLRITGIDHPQQGFRPEERITETGRHLEQYCQRFSVPFEYNCIAAQNWETIQIEDLKINDNEMLAVNCLFRFMNLLDETDEANCPRDDVLNLIRKMNPAVFIHSICNGSYNSPFFVTRFREALFQFSTYFDMFDNTILTEDRENRLQFEREFYGRETMNVLACEGMERVERPETYKQWQIRTIRAGFMQLPLVPELMGKLRDMLKAWYHKEYVLDEDSNWMLQGWKGRITSASSCWVAA